MWGFDNTVSLLREYLLEPLSSLSRGFFDRLVLFMETEHFSPKMLRVLQGKAGSKRERKRMLLLPEHFWERTITFWAFSAVLSSLCFG